MRTQRGVTLSGFLMVAAVLGVAGVLGMKAIPAWIEYGKVVKIIKQVAAEPELKDAPLANIQASFMRRAGVESVTEVTHEDLEISKEDGRLVISVAYTSKIPMFANVSLLFDFAASSDK
jgi:hypothetical protein